MHLNKVNGRDGPPRLSPPMGLGSHVSSAQGLLPFPSLSCAVGPRVSSSALAWWHHEGKLQLLGAMRRSDITPAFTQLL